MAISHTKKFGVYHWDTFDNTTILIGQADTIDECDELIKQRYGNRIRGDGADKVDVVDQDGRIVSQRSVG